MTQTETRERFARAGFAVYAISVLGMLLGGGPLQHWDIHIGVAISQIAFILVPGLVLWRFLPQKPFVFRRVSAVTILLVVITTPLVAFAANSLAGIVTNLFSLETMGERYLEGINDLLHPEETWRKVLGIVSICIIAPICEETLFRGSILHSQKPHMGFWRAAILNGVLFSVLHVNPIGFVSLAIIGFYFAILSRGGLWLAILAHGLLNFTSGVLPMFFSDETFNDVESLELKLLVPLFLVLGSLATFFCHKLWNTLPPENVMEET